MKILFLIFIAHLFKEILSRIFELKIYRGPYATVVLAAVFVRYDHCNEIVISLFKMSSWTFYRGAHIFIIKTKPD